MSSVKFSVQEGSHVNSVRSHYPHNTVTFYHYPPLNSHYFRYPLPLFLSVCLSSTLCISLSLFLSLSLPSPISLSLHPSHSLSLSPPLPRSWLSSGNRACCTIGTPTAPWSSLMESTSKWSKLSLMFTTSPSSILNLLPVCLLRGSSRYVYFVAHPGMFTLWLTAAVWCMSSRFVGRDVCCQWSEWGSLSSLLLL